MSLSKFSFIISEKKTAKGRSMLQKEYEAKKKLNFITKWQPMKCSGKPVAMDYLASCWTSYFFPQTSVTCPK